MSWKEIETLFHEFGHCSQHLLTQIDYSMASGSRGVAGDAIELPSKFTENFCYDRKTLQSFSKHIETGESLPDELLQKILQAKQYRAASEFLRQLHLGTVDMGLHSKLFYHPSTHSIPSPDYNAIASAAFAFDKLQAFRTSVLPPISENKFLCSFTHIFGSSGAWYYSYKYSEVMSADAFSAFEEAGLDNEVELKKTGARFRDTILGLGGGVDAAEVFKRFRGREPQTKALLRRSGLWKEEETQS